MWNYVIAMLLVAVATLALWLLAPSVLHACYLFVMLILAGLCIILVTKLRHAKKMLAERADGETRRAESETRRADGETRRAEGETRRADTETRRAEGETRRADIETRRAEGETRRADIETRRAEGETRRAEKAEGETAIMSYLHDLSIRLLTVGDVTAGLRDVLDNAMRMCGAHFGTIQVYNKNRQVFEIVAHKGFDEDCLAYLQTLSPEDTSSGLALRSGQRVVIEDVQSDPAYEPYCHLAARAGYRMVQSTPLVSHCGQILGVLSTHNRDPRHLLETEIHLLDICARYAGDLIERFEAKESAKENDRRKDEFLAVLAHELRNPLAPIQTGLSLLDRTDLPEEQRLRVREMLHRQVKLLTRLTNDLLDISRITRGTFELRQSDLDLAALVRQVVQDAWPYLRDRQHRISVDIPQMPVPVWGDAQRLEQVLLNILHNSIRYSEPSTPIEVSLTTEADWAVLRISDQGVGMSPDFLPRAFNQFTQAEPTLNKSSKGGLGIGLAIVRQIVTMHKGDVFAESGGLGQGTDVIVRLPLKKEGTY